MAIERSVGQIKLKLIEAASSLAVSHSELIASGNFSRYRASCGSVDALLEIVSRVEEFWVETREKLDSIGVVDPSVEEMLEVFKEIVTKRPVAERPKLEEKRGGPKAAAMSAVRETLKKRKEGEVKTGQESTLLVPPAVNEIKFNQENRSIEVKDKEIRINVNEWNVLVTLAKLGGVLGEGSELARQAFGFGKRSRPRFNAAVFTLRKKLGESAKNQDLIVSELRAIEGAEKPKAFYGLKISHPELSANGEDDNQVEMSAEEAGAVKEEGNKLSEGEIYLLARLIKDNYPELLASGDDEQLVESIISDFSETIDDVQVKGSLAKKLENFFANRDEFFDLNAGNDKAGLLLAVISSLEQRELRDKLLGTRPSEEADDERYFRHDLFTLDRIEQLVIVGNDNIHITKRVYEILNFLIQNRGKLVTPLDFKAVYGWENADVKELAENLKVHISRLRTSVRKAFGLEMPLKTIRNRGWIFK